MTTVSDRLRIEAAPFDTEGYSVTVNGGTSAEVPVGTITVQVAHTNGERTAYTIAATKVDSVEVRITVPAGTDTAVFNAADSEIAPVGSGTYRLIPGERYTWITTKQEFYHAAAALRPLPVSRCRRRSRTRRTVSARLPPTARAIRRTV